MSTHDVLFLLFVFVSVLHVNTSTLCEDEAQVLGLSDGIILDCPICPTTETETVPQILVKPQVYWKEFTGLPVPEDAISSGIQVHATGKARKIYLAQASFPLIQGSGLQPTALYNDSAIVFNSYRQTVSTSTGIKVLCSNMPPDVSDAFLKWVPSKEAFTHPESHLVTAGYELIKSGERQPYNIYFGRGYNRGLFVTGKAVKRSTGFRLYYPWQNGEDTLDNTVEILVHSEFF